jgi:hypothetical protein
VDFQEADRRYAEIKRRHEAGTLTDEEYDEQLKQLMVQDQEDRWWSKSRKTGEWHYYDGTAWIKDTPPGYEPPQAAPQAPSSPRGEASTTPAQAPTSPRTKLLRWLVPLVLVGLVIIVVAIASNTGGNSDYAGGGGSATPTSSFTATSSPTTTSSDVLFSDDFSDASSGWPDIREEDSGNYNDDGGYRIYAPVGFTRTQHTLEAGPYQDVTVEVDAKLLNSQTDAIASGVACRLQDSSNYYSMIVSGDGKVSIIKFRDADLTEIAGADRSDVIGGNVVSPHIRGDCVGNTLTLYVNGK